MKRINRYAAMEAAKKGHSIENPQAFENPNWQYLVAWWSGYRSAMRIIQEITRT